MNKIAISIIPALLAIIYGIYCLINENLKEKPIDWWTIRTGVKYGIVLTLSILVLNYYTT